MLDLAGALNVLNNVNWNGALSMPFLENWRQVYYRTSIHTTGVLPRYYPLDDRGLLSNAYTTPSGWNSEQYNSEFDRLFNKHPREPEVTRQWRKSVYRPYQSAPLLECIASNEATILGDSKYTLIVEDAQDSAYINGKNFDGMSLIEYFRFHFKSIHEDPNGLFVVMPNKARTEYEDNGKIEPTIRYVRSADIIYYDGNDLVYLEWNTPYAWFVNGIGYFRYEKIGEVYVQSPLNHDYYAHKLGKKPAHLAGGFWNSNRYYDSYLKPALPFCEDLVGASSDSKMIDKEASHPFIIETEEDCPTCNGHMQIHVCGTCHTKSSDCLCDEDSRSWSLVNCKSCNGTGQMSHNPADRWVVPKENMDSDIVKVVGFDVAMNEYLAEKCEKIAIGIRKALYQQYVDEAQSGIAKKIDRAPMYLYRSKVSNGVWDLIEACLIDILSLRNMGVSDGKRVPTPPKYILVRPTDFDLKTETDLLLEYKESTEAKMPDYIRQKQSEMFVDKIFGGDEVMTKSSMFINEMDAFSVTTIIDKTAMLSAGGISPEEYQFSNELPKMMKEVVRTRGKEWFLKATYEEVKADIQAIFARTKKLPTPDMAKTDVRVNT